VLFTDSSGTLLNNSNTLLLALAPSIAASPAPTAIASGGGTLVTLTANPQVLPNQVVQLILGGTAVPAQAFTSATTGLSFQFTPALGSGSYLARLEVDGVMSPIAVNWTATPPSFSGPMISV
jgi:hypothetical protein